MLQRDLYIPKLLIASWTRLQSSACLLLNMKEEQAKQQSI